jgi:L-amino acid N-acyltransferase YncA
VLDSAQNILIRPSTEADVPEMIAIYRHHIQRGLGEYQLGPLHAEDIKRRRKTMLKRRLPHIVGDLDGAVVGYAYAVPFRKRPAYRYTVKHSIYVHKDHLRSGVGRRLLAALIETCAEVGFRQMIACIDSANLPSIQLHEAYDFRQVGMLPSIAFKFGRWSGTVLMQRALGPGDSTPPDDRVGRIVGDAVD